MLTPPSGLSPPTLQKAIEQAWAIAVDLLEYRPVGFGSHHWVATDKAGTRHLVTADELSSDSDGEATGTAPREWLVNLSAIRWDLGNRLVCQGVPGAAQSDGGQPKSPGDPSLRRTTVGQVGLERRSGVVTSD